MSWRPVGTGGGPFWDRMKWRGDAAMNFRSEKSMFERRCQRCPTGYMVARSDQYGSYRSCLMCGNARDDGKGDEGTLREFRNLKDNFRPGCGGRAPPAGENAMERGDSLGRQTLSGAVRMSVAGLQRLWGLASVLHGPSAVLRSLPAAYDAVRQEDGGSRAQVDGDASADAVWTCRDRVHS